jgi:hypothetical protein
MAEVQHHLEAAIAVEGAFTHRMQRRELAKVLVGNHSVTGGKPTARLTYVVDK